MSASQSYYALFYVLLIVPAIKMQTIANFIKYIFNILVRPQKLLLSVRFRYHKIVVLNKHQIYDYSNYYCYCRRKKWVLLKWIYHFCTADIIFFSYLTYVHIIFVCFKRIRSLNLKMLSIVVDYPRGYSAILGPIEYYMCFALI